MARVEDLITKGNVKGLIKTLGNREPSTCSKAVFALREIGDGQAVEPLIALLATMRKVDKTQEDR